MVRTTQITVRKEIQVPLRDGTRTVGDLYVPMLNEPVPALVIRNPYNKEVELRAVDPLPSPLKLAERGYAVLSVDVRGRFASEGTFTPFRNEGSDGYDTIEWASAQDWCNGRVGIYGPSYLGACALLAARERPPSLRCAIPFITADDYFRDWVYRGGQLQVGFAAGWALQMARATVQRLGPQALSEFDARGAQAFREPKPEPLPVELAETFGLVWWNEWLAHDSDDGFWHEMSPARDYAEYDVPMFHVGGWWDLFAAGTFRNYRGLRDTGRNPQHLWVGPWAHTHYAAQFGELELGATGSAAGSGVVGAFNRFIDRYLRGDDSRSLAPVRYFLLGSMEWKDADGWPPPEAEPAIYYLRSAGNANSCRGDGLLSLDKPRADERFDRYLYDPLRPVPTAQPAGPFNHQSVEARDDVLCYSTEPLRRPTLVIGPVQVNLWAVTDAPDTAWTAKLLDVHPDGKAIHLCDSIVRASQGRAETSAEPLTPGRPELYVIDLGHTAIQLSVGHRLRLEISSSNYPKFGVHTNSLGENNPSRSRPAIQSILHSEDYSSSLCLHMVNE